MSNFNVSVLLVIFIWFHQKRRWRGLRERQTTCTSKILRNMIMQPVPYAWLYMHRGAKNTMETLRNMTCTAPYTLHRDRRKLNKNHDMHRAPKPPTAHATSVKRARNERLAQHLNKNKNEERNLIKSRALGQKYQYLKFTSWLRWSQNRFSSSFGETETKKQL